MKVVPQASNCREIEVGGRIYRRNRKGLFDMPEAAAKYTIAQDGGQVPALSGITRKGIGYRCPMCGFGSYFDVCNRCKTLCVREDAE